MVRSLTYTQAIHEALDQAMTNDPSVICYGLGADDPRGIFGTTLGLQDKFGKQRVFDMPTSENAMTGIAIGAALNGIRPVMVHQRLDFFLLAMDQLVNNAAKWHYMFAGQNSVPLTIRLITGRGWGQGPTHSQNLHALFAHIPGLKVVMPFSAYDAKGLLASAIADDNPVLFIEHRWLHFTHGPVPEEPYQIPIGQAKIVRPGKDITVAATSHMVLEALKCAEILAQEGVEVEVVDVRSLQPFDSSTIISSVEKTGRFIALDTGTLHTGFSAEMVATVSEKAFQKLKKAPMRLGVAECPLPTSEALSIHCYSEAFEIAEAICKQLGHRMQASEATLRAKDGPRDVPDKNFSGPF